MGPRQLCQCLACARDAIRLGPVSDSALIVTRLGTLPRYLCASPEYVAEHGYPQQPNDLKQHLCIEMPGSNGRARTWSFRQGEATTEVNLTPKVSVNDAITIHRMIRKGSGVGVVSGYLCEPDFKDGTLVRLLPDWNLPSVDVSILYPSKRELSPAVRALADYLREVTVPGRDWQVDISADV